MAIFGISETNLCIVLNVLLINPPKYLQNTGFWFVSLEILLQITVYWCKILPHEKAKGVKKNIFIKSGMGMHGCCSLVVVVLKGLGVE